MHYSAYITTLLTTLQTLLKYTPMIFSPERSHQLPSQSTKSQLKVINLGLYPIITTEFGARASIILRSKHHQLYPHDHRRNTSVAEEIMTVLAGEDDHAKEHKNEILCSSAVINNRAKMEIEAFDEARKTFCENVNGIVIPVGQALTVRISKAAVRHGARRRSVIGMIENNGNALKPADDSEAGEYVVDAYECLGATEVFVSETWKNCQIDGVAQGGMNHDNGSGVAFVIFPVDN